MLVKRLGLTPPRCPRRGEPGYVKSARERQLAAWVGRAFVRPALVEQYGAAVCVQMGCTSPATRGMRCQAHHRPALR
jgi:hypothetical protein